MIGPDAARKADAPILFPEGQGAEVQRRRRRRRASVVVRQCPRADRRLLAQEEVGARRRSPRRGRRATRCCSRGRSGPESSSTPASSRMRRSPASTATNSPSTLSTQAVAELRTKIAKRFKLDPAKVRVVAEHIGGGFGSKATLGAETVIAIKLAQAAKAPVRVAFDRHEELSVAGYRPAAEVKVAILPGRDGALKALSLTAHSDAGVAVNSTVAGLARLIYRRRGQGAYRLRRRQQPAAGLRRFAARAARRWRSRSNRRSTRRRFGSRPIRLRCASAGIPIPIASASTTGPPGSRPGAGALGRRAADAAATAAASASPRATGSISGSSERRSSSRSRAAASSPAPRRRTSAPGHAASSPTRSRANSASIRTRSRSASAIRSCRKGRHPAAAGSPRRSCRRSSSPPASSRPALPTRPDASRRRDRTRRGGSSSPPRPISRSRRSARRTIRPDRLRQQFAAQGRRLIGWIFGFMMRRSSHLAIGAGAPSSVQVIEVEVDTLLGHVRVLGAHSGIAVGKLAAPALARNQASGAVIQGLGYALYEGREIDAATGDVLTDEPRRLPHAGHRRHSADRRLFRRGRLRPCAWRQRRHRRGRDRADGGGDRQRRSATRSASGRTRSRSGPTGCSIFSIGGARHDGDDANRPRSRERPNSAPRAPTSRSAAAAASRAGRSSTSFRLAGMTGIALGRGGSGAHRRVDVRSPRSRPTPGLRRPIPASPPRQAVWRRRRSGISPPSAAISPSVRAAGTTAIPHIACLKKGGERMPGARGQPSLRRRVRSRAVRRPASLDHGDGASWPTRRRSRPTSARA